MPLAAHARAATFARNDYKNLALAALGGALEIYDFIIFIFFAFAISQLFFPPEMEAWLRLLQSFGIFITGYLARPLGGILMAHFADRLGRKRMFNLSVLMMALPSLLIGLMPTYAQLGYWAPLSLLLLRVVQGAAVGGEVPSAWVFVAEHMPASRQGLALGILQAGLTFGYLLGAISATLVTRLYSPEDVLDYAWRIPFIVGGAFGFIAVWLRSWLQETPVFLAMRAEQASQPRLPLADALRHQRASLLPAVILTCVLTTAVVILVVVTPTALQSRFGLPALQAFSLTCVGIMALNIGCVLGGWVADRLGPWRAVRLYSLALIPGVALLYLGMNDNLAWMAAIFAIAGLCSGIVGVVPSAMIQLFPARSRVSGISFVYNITYALWGSMAPLALMGLVAWHPAAVVVFALLVGVIGAAFARRPVIEAG